VTFRELHSRLLARAGQLDQDRDEHKAKAAEQKHRSHWAWGWHDAKAQACFLQAEELRKLADEINQQLG